MFCPSCIGVTMAPNGAVISSSFPSSNGKPDAAKAPSLDKVVDKPDVFVADESVRAPWAAGEDKTSELKGSWLDPKATGSCLPQDLETW